MELPELHPSSVLTPAELEASWSRIADDAQPDRWQRALDGGVEVIMGAVSYEDGSFRMIEQTFAESIPLPLTPEEALELSDDLMLEIDEQISDNRNALAQWAQLEMLLPVMYVYLAQFALRYGVDLNDMTDDDAARLPDLVQRGAQAMESVLGAKLLLDSIRSDEEVAAEYDESEILDLLEEIDEDQELAYEEVAEALRSCIARGTSE